MIGSEAALLAIDTEIRALRDLRDRCADEIGDALDLLQGCRGHVVISGIGKSGHIGAKIAATFASTGTPSFFVHSTEALHGDSGMVTADDVIILISNSGKTAEVCQFGRMVKARDVPIIAMTSDPHSPLARLAQVHLSIAVEKEADPLGLAPSSSTTCTLVLGDALAAGLMAARGFTDADFAQFHPGGALGELLTEGEGR